ncbi:hypothetical protein ACGFNF_00195 [Micromonospora sp. NPDC048868]|uniref:hypothetical protein n=1 Tax=Micromonospora sp. NPDC048868 TaxID=3364258 RepID=UPI003719583D
MTASRRMRLALAVSRFASAALPVSDARSRYREQWEADIHGAADIGLSPLRLALGTAVAALQLAATTRKGTAVLASGNIALAIRAAGAPRVRTGLAVTQLGFGVLYAVVLVLYAVSRIRLGLGHYELTHEMHDPKDLVPFGFSLLNPFTWLFITSQLYIMLHGWMLGAVLATGSLVHALTGNDRWRRLSVTATAVSAVVLAIALSGFGWDIFVWVRD